MKKTAMQCVWDSTPGIQFQENRASEKERSKGSCATLLPKHQDQGSSNKKWSLTQGPPGYTMILNRGPWFKSQNSLDAYKINVNMREHSCEFTDTSDASQPAMAERSPLTGSPEGSQVEGRAACSTPGPFLMPWVCTVYLTSRFFILS